MRKWSVIILFFFLMPFIREAVHAEKLITLPDVLHPTSMHVDAKQLYIVDGHTILIYSLDGFRLMKKFGKVGEGPDAFKAKPGGNVDLIIDVQTENIVVNSYEWVSIFSKEGEFVSSMNPYPQTDYVIPMEEKYIASYSYIHVGTGKSAEHILIFDKNLEFVKKITEGFVGSGSAKGFGGPDRMLHIDLVPPFFGFRVYEDKIYVGDTTKGFFIEVYNSKGEKLYEMNRNYDEIKVTDDYKEKRRKEIHSSTYSQRYKDFVVIDEVEYFPAFGNFTVADEKIYVFTYEEVDSQLKIIIMDLEGNEVNFAYIPKAEVNTIQGGRYFYLVQNEDNEWELHRTSLTTPNRKNESTTPISKK